MELIANILLATGAVGAGIYCLILSKRIRQMNRLEDGVGGAIAILSVQVDDMTKALKLAQKAAAESETNLRMTTERAETVLENMEHFISAPAPEQDEPRRRSLRVQRHRTSPIDRRDNHGDI